MISKQKIKFITSLRYSKYRLKYNCFVIEGPHLVNEFINSDFKVHSCFSTKEWAKNYQANNMEVITQDELEKISFLKNPSNVLAIVYKNNLKFDVNKIMQDNRIILLDSISDPGNMGSIIRTADWFGIDSIYLSKTCVDVFNPKVVQATMGSLSRVKVYVVDLETILKKIKQNNIISYGASLSGTSIYKIDNKKQCALVFGNESRGISLKINKLLDQEILIPSKNTNIDSLNVSVAFGIILSEFR